MTYKLPGICLLAALIMIFLLTVFPPPIHAEEPLSEAIYPTSNVGGYVYLNDEKIGFATFLIGQGYQLQSEDEHFYHVSFGNGLLYVDKNYAEKGSFLNPGKLPKGKSTVIPKKRIHVLSQPQSGSPSLGYLNPDIRVPAIQKINGYYEINFGGHKGYIAISQTNPDNGIPVLMYHHVLHGKAVSEHADNNMAIEYIQFEEQMHYLKEYGWRTISMQQMEDWLSFQSNLPDKVVAITFDDGISSTVELAYPLLKKLDFIATSFVITGKIRGSSDYWIASDLQYVGLKEIRNTTDVFDYQHHSDNMHLYQPGAKAGMFTTKSYDAIKQDLENGKVQLGKAFSSDTARTKYLAYPFGHYNQTTIDAARDAGIHLAFTTMTGNVMLSDSPYELKRQGIAPYHSIIDFIHKLEGTYKQYKLDFTLSQ